MIRNKALLALSLSTTALLGLSNVACDSNSMDRDLKRQADRATIQLNRAQNERDDLKAQLDAAKKSLAAEKARADAAQSEISRAQSERDEARKQVTASRQRIQELEEAAIAARQGMPTTRRFQP